MSVRIHGRPIPDRPDTRGLADAALRAACWRGELPAEALSTADREHLVYELWRAGWSDVEIATHTRLTTYTTARIRDRLGLRAHHARSKTS